MGKYVLKLFVTGINARSEKAIKNLKEICNSAFPNEYELIVIDVLESPEIAEEEKILATPTLVKTLPLPIRRLIGDLSDKEKVLLYLDINKKQA
ncbi:MAG: hypothetical protein JW798_03535 [Prolixibacteraceae bacterium]|nr:hypothetical protein [Prolixibacteraceae bacterium]